MLQWLNQFLLSGNWHYSILFSLQPANAVSAESKYLCAKVRNSHLWSMSLTTGRDSSHDPAILTAAAHTCTNTNLNLTHSNANTHTHTHTPLALPSAVADVPTWHRVPGQRFTLDRICSTFVILYSSKAHLLLWEQSSCLWAHISVSMSKLMTTFRKQSTLEHSPMMSVDECTLSARILKKKHPHSSNIMHQRS